MLSLYVILGAVAVGVLIGVALFGKGRKEIAVAVNTVKAEADKVMPKPIPAAPAKPASVDAPKA